MKKRFVPFGLTILIYLLIFIIVTGIALGFIFAGNGGIAFHVVATIFILLILYYFVSPMIYYSINLDKEILSIKKDFAIFKEDRIQQKKVLNLKEIKGFQLILTDRDSEGNPYKGKAQKKKYLEFILNDDKKVRFYVSLFSKKQLKKLIESIETISNYKLNEINTTEEK